MREALKALPKSLKLKKPLAGKKNPVRSESYRIMQQCDERTSGASIQEVPFSLNLTSFTGSDCLLELYLLHLDGTLLSAQSVSLC